MSQSSPSVERVVSVLNFFAEHPGQSFTFTDIVRALKLGRATCHALLTALVEARYLYRNTDKSYVIGPALVELGQIAKEHFSPLQAAQPEMRNLADEFEAICSAVFLENGFAVVKARATAMASLSWSIPQGSRLPLRPPFGAVFYAWHAEADVAQWLNQQQPPPTAEQRQSMADAIKFTRTLGFAFGVHNPTSTMGFDLEQTFAEARPEYPTSMAAEINTNRDYKVAFIEAPVFDPNSRVAFVLILTGFTQAIPGHKLMLMGLRLREACDNLTKFLSGKKPPLEHEKRASEPVAD